MYFEFKNSVLKVCFKLLLTVDQLACWITGKNPPVKAVGAGLFLDFLERGSIFVNFSRNLANTSSRNMSFGLMNHVFTR